MPEPGATYEAYGKVNLYLDMLDRRPDGYTNIETIFQSVGLYDTLTFVPSESPSIELACSDERVPLDGSNLILQASEALRPHAAEPAGYRVQLEKRLPIAGGMAGGSADAAATLVALNELWRCGLDEDSLARIAADLGSDIPFCLRGGTAAATERGGKFHDIAQLAETWLVLLLPGIAIGAGELYNHPKLERSLEHPVEGWTPAFLHAIQMCERGDLARLVFNRMETPAFSDHTELARYKEQLLEAGCIAAAMSGSGSALFGVCESQTAANEIAAHDFGCEALALPTVAHGVRRAGSQD